MIEVSPWIGAFIAAGAFLVVAYNLELFGGTFHSDLWFALAWGALPLLTGYAASAGRVSAGAVVAAVWATLLSLAQRRLSTPVRRLRRQVTAVRGELELADGSVESLDAAALTEAPEAALRLLTLATIALAAALVVVRLYS